LKTDEFVVSGDSVEVLRHVDARKVQPVKHAS